MSRPLVPSNIDLRSFEYMPLDVVRLRDSDFTALTSAEAFRAGILLWCAAWHQVPAGSLPSDDRVLSNLAGYGRVVKEWEKVKEEALHGWILCDDGRYYHPVICEKALESWVSKQEYSYKKFVDRLRKKNGNLKKDGMAEIEIPDFNVWISTGMPNDWDSKSNTVPVESNSNSNGKENNSVGIPLENPLKGTEQNIRDNINNTHTLSGAANDFSQEQKQETQTVEDWQPSLDTLNTKLKMAGATAITQATLDQTLVTFNPHYESHHLSDNKLLAKLVTWIKSDQERQKTRATSKPTSSRPAKTNLHPNRDWENQPPPEYDDIPLVDVSDMI